MRKIFPDDFGQVPKHPYGEVVELAVNLARNCGYRVFPVDDDKRPALKRWPERASNDRAAIARMWHEHPAPLIGIATGERSGIDVHDLDAKHDAARAWYAENHRRLPSTRTYRTRSGGAHLHLRHAVGVRNSQGKIATGVDVRGDGGYAVHWSAAGFECLDHDPPAPWPAWLLEILLAKPTPAPPPITRRIDRTADAAIDGVLRLVANAAEGERNAVLHWASCRLGERVHAGQVGRAEAERLLIAAAIAAGLSEKEARATVQSGLRRAAA